MIRQTWRMTGLSGSQGCPKGNKCRSPRWTTAGYRSRTTRPSSQTGSGAS
jgi:hypothetical protein